MTYTVEAALVVFVLSGGDSRGGGGVWLVMGVRAVSGRGRDPKVIVRFFVSAGDPLFHGATK